MIAALKQAIAIYADDPAWRTVRPRLVELTPEQAKTLAAELNAIGFTMPGVRRGVFGEREVRSQRAERDKKTLKRRTSNVEHRTVTATTGGLSAR